MHVMLLNYGNYGNCMLYKHACYNMWVNCAECKQSLILALLEFKYVQCTELSDPHQIILRI